MRATAARQVFRLPDLGEGLTEAEILEWKVSVGDTVEVDQIVVEVETAKAAVEVPVPYAGTVLALHAAPGAVLSVGLPLIEIGPPAATADQPEPGSGAAAQYREEERAGSGNVLIGYGTGHAPGTRRRRRTPRPASIHPPTGHPTTGSLAADDLTAGSLTPDRATDDHATAGSGQAEHSASSHTAADRTMGKRLTPARPVGGRPVGDHPISDRPGDNRRADLRGAAEADAFAVESQAPRVISPLVRRMARDHGIDLTDITPTGPHAVILRRDVERAIAEQTGTEPAIGEQAIAERAVVEQSPGEQAIASQAVPPQATPAHVLTTRTSPHAPTPVPAAAVPASADDAPGARARGLVDERIPLRGLRRAVAEKLSRSRAEIPDATTWVDVDATDLLAARDALRRSRPDLGIGLMALLARICVDGLRRFPELNSSVDTDRSEIVRYGHVNLGFAAQTDRGLVVPVIRDAHLMTTAELAAELTRLTALARAGRLSPQALTGGTFTLNNYGVFGVDGSTPIINHPEAALLGVGRIIDRPWVSGGVVTARKITQLSFTFDHRVCDGGTAGGFLRHVADCVENPAILLADV
ncbi:2-oxo acid dehydrogenase subunit E2 [Nonomuraea maheshkhaliensis]|uniref:Dihydrolipoamide acetyltransferase component of pyruvate dehydrogenase complex n=1 Tax=Nonomuraea maheshkhaliensis TaxID=419590 RepID=A0ABN2FZG9_9ACTN